MPAPSPPLRTTLRRLLGVSGATFGVVLGLVVLDIAAGVRLPEPVRPALPWLLAGSMLLGITLLVGALGAPPRRQRD